MNRPHGTLRAAADRDPSRLGVGLYLSIHAPDGTIYAIDPSTIEWREVSELGAYATPAFMIPEEDAPRVAEAFAREGYGPSRAERIAGELEATRSHRDDLRTLLGLGENAGAEIRATIKVDR